jgi:beta-galactosidase
MTEIQGGNNLYSGNVPMCPTRQEITQWLWTIIGCGGKGGIFWCLNPRASGFEAGEWALIDYQNQPSDRLLAAAAVSRLVQENEELFAHTRPVETPIHILYIRESLWVERRLQRGGIHYEGREVGGVMKSALGYFQTLCEMGINPQLAEISEFDFSLSDYTGVTLILAHQVSLPSRYWPQIENFVKYGGKLIMDGLTAYYDEHAHCIMKTGFPLANICGANVKEFKLGANLFKVELVDPELVLPGHCWQGTLNCQGATPVGYSGDEIIGTRHKFGRGEVVWIPTLLGLAARLDNNVALATLLYLEAQESIARTPFRSTRHQPDVLSRNLESNGAYVSILINKNSKPVDIELVLPDKIPPDCQPVILSATQGGQIIQDKKFHLPPEATLVAKWCLP